MYKALFTFAAKKHLFWGSYKKPTPEWAKDAQKIILMIAASYGGILANCPAAVPVNIQAAILHYGVLGVPALVLFFGYFKITMPATLQSLEDGSYFKTENGTENTSKETEKSTGPALAAHQPDDKGNDNN